ELAGEVNSRMPRYVVEQVMRGLNRAGKAVNGAHIAIIGIAYKKDVDDSRESPAFEIIEELLELGAQISYHGPHVLRLPRTRRHDLKMVSQPLTAEYLAAQDCVLIITDHSTVDWELVVRHAPLIVDPRNATGCIPGPREHVIS